MSDDDLIRRGEALEKLESWWANANDHRELEEVIGPTTLAADAAQALQGVTEGPWTVEYKHGTIRLMMADDCQMCDETYYPWVPDNEKDWHFIAFARAWVPEAAAALTALSEQNAALAAQVAELLEWKRYWSGEYETVLAGRADETDRADAAEAKVAELTADRDKWFEGAGAHHVASMKQAQRADIAEAKLKEVIDDRNYQEFRADNHWETLRSIRDIAKSTGDLARIIQWVDDAGSGYNETAETTLAAEMDRRRAAEDKVAQGAKAHEREIAVWSENYAALERKVARLDGALGDIDALDDSAECCGQGVSGGYGPPECCCQPLYGLDRAKLIARAALTEGTPTEYERKVAQMKEDFPNGI